MFEGGLWRCELPGGSRTEMLVILWSGLELEVDMLSDNVDDELGLSVIIDV